MDNLSIELAAAPRVRLLRYLASAIHGFTVMARDDLDDEKKASINNRIHYLSGHLKALLDPEQPLDDWRLTAILNETAPLYGVFTRRMREELNAPRRDAKDDAAAV